jgi:hypothetical protein
MPSSVLYARGAARLSDGTLKWAAGENYRAALVSAYTPDHAADHVWGDVSAKEIAAGNGYTSGGAALANLTTTEDDAGKRAKLDADDVSWANATFSADGVVIYSDGATKHLIAYVDFGGTKTSSGGTFLVAWNAAGLITLTSPA